ncbi:MAG: NAD(P)/FAD-dependent oxidoreductase [Methanopyri archaeon]|jgi:glycerol-3-phosphate dehydrogenase|nr:NAD(P)/FAD-dependent oxidoreductase [Methanopyri archaeon]
MGTTRIVIAGGGIVGCAIARELSRYQDLDITVLERKAEIGMGVSKANTAIIHAGFDDDPDKAPVKAALCARGNELWHTLVVELEIPCVWPGSLVVATDDDQLPTVEALLARAERNNVPDCELWDADMLRTKEPALAEGARLALFAPTAGVISPFDAVFALMENACANGARLVTGAEVTAVRFGKEKEVETTAGTFGFDVLINAAGLYADTVSHMAGITDFTIGARKGEYLLFDKALGPLTNHIVFPAPSKMGKGILVTFTAEGHTMIGPNAQDIPDKDDFATTAPGIDEVYEGARKLVPKLYPRGQCIRTFAGVRPEPSTGDFIVKAYDGLDGFINTAGIRSPGLASAPAIAERVASLLIDQGIELNPSADFWPERKAIPRFAEMDAAERDAAIREDPAYGRVVCRCETVTEAEVVEAVHRGATTLDGVKLRTRAGMGRCQSGFCSFRVLDILARELGVDRSEITKRGGGSRMTICGTKDLRRDEK